MAKKGYFLFDTQDRKAQFVEIESRPFFYEEMVFGKATDAQVRERIRETVTRIRKASPDCLIAIKVDGTLKEGLAGSDIRLEGFDNVFIESRLDVESLSSRLEKIRSGREASLSVRDLALRELREKTAGKITLFDSSELFEKLVEGADETLEYLEKHNKKESK